MLVIIYIPQRNARYPLISLPRPPVCTPYCRPNLVAIVGVIVTKFMNALDTHGNDNTQEINCI